jgi:hypothetical protein
MTLFFKKTKNIQTTSADVVNDHLILSLLGAKDPKIWRMSLDKIGTASLEIKQEKDSAVTKLILKPKKGTAEIIASFNSQEEALEALTLAAEALQHKDTQEKMPIKHRENTGNTNPETSTSSSKWIIVLLGLVIVIGLYYYLDKLIPNKNIGFEKATSSQTNTSSPQETIGVPVSADDFLNGR